MTTEFKERARSKKKGDHDELDDRGRRGVTESTEHDSTLTVKQQRHLCSFADSDSAPRGCIKRFRRARTEEMSLLYLKPGLGGAQCPVINLNSFQLLRGRQTDDSTFANRAPKSA